MQTISVKKVDGGEKRERIVSIVADKYCRAILNHITGRPKSALEISRETKVSISTVYRKLQHLCDLKMLKVSGRINDDGRKYFFYQSKIKSISIFFEDGILVVKVTVNDSHT